MDEPFPALSNLRILIVEDEAMIVMMLEDMLEDFGCVVQTAPSIEQAMETLSASSPDGVLLDMNIHGRKPVALAEELVSRSVPFLLVTGYGSGNGEPPVIKAAPRLQKPFDGKELARRMMEVFVAGQKHSEDAQGLSTSKSHPRRNRNYFERWPPVAPSRIKRPGNCFAGAYFNLNPAVQLYGPAPLS